MTNSNAHCKTTAIIDEIFELLDADYLNQIIDSPIEEAFESFEFDPKTPMTFQNFVKTIGDFIAHIYRFGPRVTKTLSERQARSEALQIIDNCYWHCSKDIRLDTAYLDAADKETAGIQIVLQQMANHIKEKTREIHIIWVFRTRFKSLDWQDQCLITKAFINREKPFIPAGLLNCHPDQLTHDLDDLMRLIIEANSKMPK